MRSVRVVEGSSRFEVDEIGRPALRQGAVRVRILAAFLPPYFEHLPSGGWMTPPRPFTPGQCAIGVIEELDPAIGHLKVGRRVYCDMYVEGPGPEADQAFIGCFGINPAAARHLAAWPDGTFAEEFVGPEQCFTPIPEGIAAAPEVLCRLGWFATALAGFRRGGFRPGMVVAINGATGLLGSTAAVVACAIGAAEVRLIGRRRALLEGLAGLDARLVIEGAGDATPVDFALDCAGGAETASTAALAGRLKRFGSLTFVGALTAPVAVDTSRLMRNGNRLVGSFWFCRGTAAEALNLIASGAIDLSPFRAVTFGLDRIGEAMRHSVAHSGGLTHVALTP